MGRYLDAGPLTPSPSEAHGLLCGLICGGDPHALESWLGQVAPRPEAGATLAAEGRAALRQCGLAIEREFQGPESLIRLPSPAEDAAPLGERALRLYDWIRGFLYAFGLVGRSEADLSEQVREILRDLTTLTRMDLDTLEETEDNEQALAELIEFVRVAAMLIHHECAVVRLPTRGGPAPSTDQETDPG
ncbi:YecA family protein [Thermochromatium tepidum]|uniref:YecA family protein n=1 Tax=Thermochromatium tepidum TaxID=1050 RepID=UPI002483DB78|nr:YecA family protein [Thermochromatium tepidum]